MPYHVLEKQVQVDSGFPVLLSFNGDNSFVSELCIMILRRRRKIPQQAVVSSETSLLGVVRSTLPSFNDFETEAASRSSGKADSPLCNAQTHAPGFPVILEGNPSAPVV